MHAKLGCLDESFTNCAATVVVPELIGLTRAIGITIAPGEAVVVSTVVDQGETFAKESLRMLWTILVILLILWLLGFIGSVGGNLIHLLLVVAAVILIINLVSGRRPVV